MNWETLRKNTSALSLLAMLVILLTLLSKPYLATNVPLISDEFTEIHLGARISRGELPYSAAWTYEKTPGLSFYLALPPILFSDGPSIVLLARLSMLPIALLLLIAVWKTALELRGRDAAFFALIFLCCCTTFIDRSFRMRTDLVSTTFWAWALYFLLAKGKKWSFLKASILLACGFLFTQKAVYFAFAGFLLCFLKSECSKKRALAEFATGMTITFALYLLFFTLCGLGWQCIAINFRAAKVGVSQFYSNYKYSMTEFLRSPAFWLAALLGLFSEWKRKARSLGLIIVSVLLFALTLNHGSKWPYYYLKLLPTCALLASFLFADLLVLLKSKLGPQKGEYIALLAVVLLFICPALWRFKTYWHGQALMDYQLATITWVEETTEPDDAFFDGVGTVPTRPRSYRDLFVRDLIAYGQGLLPDLIEILKRNECKVHILNYRSNNLPQKEKNWLNEHFVHDWGNIFVAGAEIVLRDKSVAEKFELHCSGNFLLEHSVRNASIIVDGQNYQSGKNLKLDKGIHVAKSDRKGRIKLRYRALGKKAPQYRPRAITRIYARYED